ncbi:MAG: hypothetical protein ACR2KM_07095 [Gemmatimonadaceae bacterium]
MLTPDDGDALEACFIIAGIVGVASAIVGYTQSAAPGARRLLGAVFGFGMLGALSTGLLTTTLTDIVLGKRYFPPNRTETFHALLPIGRAYRSESRTGYSWTIQPTPLWENIDITKSDYDFMVANKRVDDVPDEPESVSSRAAFCASVIMQRSGDALRVLHAGRHTLPQGSVVRCPPAAMGQPYIEQH